MSHEKVFGFCENLCETEVEPKSRTENLYNPNLLVNCDDFSYVNRAMIDNTSTSSLFNVTLNKMVYAGNGFEPIVVESSGDIEMRYQIARRQMGVSAERLPMTLQVRFVASEASGGTGVTLKTYVFDETDDEFTETMGSVTWRITLTGYSVKIYWTKTAGVLSEYQFAGAKLELGNVPTRYDISNTLGKTIDLVWTESINRFLSRGDSLPWKNTPNGGAKWYFYEGASTSGLDIPTANCIVLVFKQSVSRGVAFAFGWDGVSTNKTVWKNTCHDIWKGWTSLHSN